MSSLFDSRGKYFQDGRRCYWCDNLIELREAYDYIIACGGLAEGLKIYFCEKCLEMHPEDRRDEIRK